MSFFSLDTPRDYVVFIGLILPCAIIGYFAMRVKKAFKR